MKKTPLYDSHLKLGAKMVPFAGFEMPVQYPTGLITEHNSVRNNVGMFDVSHMGEIFVSGDSSFDFLQRLTCNDLSKLEVGKAQYSALLNKNGGVIDDIIVYKLEEKRFLICVNASNCEKDFDWLTSQNREKAIIENQSSLWGQIAVQGPKAKNFVQKFCSKELKYFECEEVEGMIIARTGYTGEDGFEIFLPADKTETLWNELLQAGVPPCGLGARDTLRLEACYPLHGHELREDISAIESGLGWIVKFSKGDFIGKEALQGKIERKLVGFFVQDLGIVREGSQIFDESGELCGFVTSGTKTPTINRALGLAIVSREPKFAEVRSKRLKIEGTKTPFYRTKNPPPR